MATRISQGVRSALLTDLDTDFANCVIGIFTGSPPANANLAETGTLLALITESGGAFTGGVATNGLNFDHTSISHQTAYSELPMTSSESWKGTAIATGVAGWGRIYANAYTTGESTTALRIDGICGRSNAQFILADLNITLGEDVVVQECNVVLPAY